MLEERDITDIHEEEEGLFHLAARMMGLTHRDIRCTNRHDDVDANDIWSYLEGSRPRAREHDVDHGYVSLHVIGPWDFKVCLADDQAGFFYPLVNKTSLERLAKYLRHQKS